MEDEQPAIYVIPGGNTSAQASSAATRSQDADPEAVNPYRTNKLPPIKPNAISPSDANAIAPPPSYESLFGKVRKAKAESKSKTEFCKKVKDIIMTSVGFVIVIGALLLLPLAELVIGAVYIDDCPLNIRIPIWLIVSGIILPLLIVNILIVSKQTKKEKKNCLSNTLTFLLIANMIFFFIGSSWVYNIRTVRDDNVDSENYCHAVPYWLAFSVITLIYTIFILFMLGFVFLAIVVPIFKKR